MAMAVMNERARSPAILDRPNDSGRPTYRCQICHRPASHRCSRCRVAEYCGRACQLADWARHKRECKRPIERARVRRESASRICAMSHGAPAECQRVVIVGPAKSGKTTLARTFLPVHLEPVDAPSDGLEAMLISPELLGAYSWAVTAQDVKYVPAPILAAATRKIRLSANHGVSDF